MDVTDLERLLSELRVVRDDHQTVEAKRAARELPASVWETLSAFANSVGGVLLLGVDEANKAFTVTGVEDPGMVSNALRAVCAELEPPLRPVIETVVHENGAVVVATINPLPRYQRPCYKRSGGPTASFIRVGDGDQKLTQAEVDEMQAERSNADFSRRPAAEGATLDDEALSGFLRAYRVRNPRLGDLDDEELLRRAGVVLDDGTPTLAAVLVLGHQPQAFEAAADVAISADPDRSAPAGSRMRSTHVRGTAGELLDDTFAAVIGELTTFQVERGGAVLDESDAPREAIRELLSNALMHRSFTPAMAPAPVQIHVSEATIEVTSPGGLHPGVEPALLGLPGGVAALRNLTLVNIAELVTTPSGARIIEHQGSGIAAADRACRNAGTMPALFIDRPTTLHAILLRGRLDETAAAAVLAERGVTVTANAVRVVAVALRLRALRSDAPGHLVGRVPLDARLAARALSPCLVEDAAAELRHLEDRGVLIRRTVGRDPSWDLAPGITTETDEPTEARGDRVTDLLTLIVNAPNAELSPAAIGKGLGLSSPSSRNKWIQRCVQGGLIEATNEHVRASNQTYRLTAKGRAEFARRSPNSGGSGTH